MKTKMKFLMVILALIISAGISQKQASAQQGHISFQIFYDQLSPYGQWIDYDNYGYVWFPDAGPNFVPYSSGGHWALSEYGWTWVSNYSWGWAPFHYGRWDYDNRYGWFWVPDNEWGPSWVEWRRADGYYGWRPMGSRFSISFGNDYNRYNDHWMFVRDRYIGRTNIDRYYANRYDYDRIYSNSATINNTYYDRDRNTSYSSGPTGADVLRDTGTRLKPVTIQEYNKPGQDLRGSQLRIYRPEVMDNSEMVKKPAPSRVTDMNEIKRSYERNSSTPRRGVTPNDYNRTNPPPVYNQENNIQNERQMNQNRENKIKNEQQLNQNRENERQINLNRENKIKNEQQMNQNRENMNKNEPPVNINRENMNRNEPPVNMNRENMNKNEPPVNINRENMNKNEQPANIQNVNPPKKEKEEGLQNSKNQQNKNEVQAQPVPSKREAQSNTTKQERQSVREKQKNNRNK